MGLFDYFIDLCYNGYVLFINKNEVKKMKEMEILNKEISAAEKAVEKAIEKLEKLNLERSELVTYRESFLALFMRLESFRRVSWLSFNDVTWDQISFEYEGNMFKALCYFIRKMAEECNLEMVKFEVENQIVTITLRKPSLELEIPEDAWRRSFDFPESVGLYLFETIY